MSAAEKIVASSSAQAGNPGQTWNGKVVTDYASDYYGQQQADASMMNAFIQDGGRVQDSVDLTPKTSKFDNPEGFRHNAPEISSAVNGVNAGSGEAFMFERPANGNSLTESRGTIISETKPLANDMPEVTEQKPIWERTLTTREDINERTNAAIEESVAAGHDPEYFAKAKRILDEKRATAVESTGAPTSGSGFFSKAVGAVKNVVGAVNGKLAQDKRGGIPIGRRDVNTSSNVEPAQRPVRSAAERVAGNPSKTAPAPKENPKQTPNSNGQKNKDEKPKKAEQPKAAEQPRKTFVTHPKPPVAGEVESEGAKADTSTGPVGTSKAEAKPATFKTSAKPSEGSVVNETKPSAEVNEKNMTPEQRIANRLKAQQRGSKVLDAAGNINMVISEKISEKQAEKEAASVTYRALKERDDAIRAKRAEKAKAKAEKSRIAQFLKGHRIIGGGVNLAKAIPVGLLDKTVGTVKRSIAARDYYKTAAEAIKATGNLSAGQSAIDELRTAIDNKEKFKGRREAVVEKVKDAQKGISLDLFNATSPEDIDKASGLIDPDKAVVERAEQAVRAGDSILRDKGIELVDADAEKKNKLTEDLKEYANLVASWDTDKTEFSKEEQSSRDVARENIINTINEVTDGSISNAADIVRLIENGLGGVFKEEMSPDHAKHDEAIEAINNYIDNHFNLKGFRVKDSGLALDEGQIVNKTDKLTVNSNVMIGIAVGLGGSLATGIAKSTMIQRITNSQLVMAATKVVLASTIGGVRGYQKAKTQQLKSNIDAALGIKPEGPKTRSDKLDAKVGLDTINSKAKNKADKVSVNNLMLDVREITDKLNSGELSNEDAIETIGEILARLDFQDEKRSKNGKGKVNLFRYESKDRIERGKAELFDAMNEAAERLKAAGIDVETEFGRAKKRQHQKLEQEYSAIVKSELKDRWKAAGKSAAIAAVAAAIATYAWDEYKHGGEIRKEINDLAAGRRKFNWKNLHIDDVNSEAAMAGVVSGRKAGQEAQEQIQQNMNNNPNKGPFSQNPEQNPGATEQLKLSEKGQVYIEDDPDGGQYLGVDKDGDGTIDEYLFGGKTGDGTKGINLNNESDLGLANGTLREKYGVELIRDPSVGEKLSPMKVAAYIDSQPNAMKGININDVNWNKSQQLCSIEREIKVFPNDGAELYEVPIDGKVPAGAKLYIDLDGNGPGAPLEYTIENGRALVPASVLDVQTGGTAKFIGTVRVANVENGQFISYTTNIGKKTLSAEDMLNTRVEETGSIISVQDATKGTVINQTALDGEGHTVSNLSEAFNGRPVANSTVSRVPYMLQEKAPAAGVTANVAKLENGAEIPNWEYKGGYKDNFDASLNYMFKEKASYVGTPMTLDVNGDGIIDSTESAAYINQMFVRTATNPYVLAENASAYGLLEPSTMNDLGFTTDVLRRLGITDGKVDTMDELNLLIEELKKPGNADLYDKLVNGTLSRMREDLEGAQFEVIDLGARNATYLNNNNALDFIDASRTRTAVTYYKIVNGEKVYIGNKGMFGDGKKPVYDILACEQKGIKKPPVTTPPKEPELPPPVEEKPPVTPPETPPAPETPPVPETPPTPVTPPETPPTPVTPPETPPNVLTPKTDPIAMKPRTGDGTLPPVDPNESIGPVTERPIIGNGEATGVDIHEVTSTSASSGSGTGGGQTLDEARESYRRIMGLDDDEEIAA